MHEGEWDGLDPNGIGSKSSEVTKGDPAAKKKLPAKDLEKGIPRQVRGHALVIGLRRGIEFGKEPDDRRHQGDAAEGDDESRAPIAESKTIVTGRLAEHKDYENQWDKKKEDGLVDFCRGRDVVIGKDDQQQGADDCDNGDFAICVKGAKNLAEHKLMVGAIEAISRENLRNCHLAQGVE